MLQYLKNSTFYHEIVHKCWVRKIYTPQNIAMSSYTLLQFVTLSHNIRGQLEALNLSQIDC